MLRDRDGIALALLLAPLSAVWMGLYGWGNTFFWGDLTYLHHPWRALAAEMLQAGRLPLWNPYAYLGMPLAAQMQGAVWYPGTVPFHCLPFAAALAVFHAMHYGLAGLFTYLWLRKEGFDRAASWAAAAAFAGSGVLVSRVPFLNHLSSLAYLPAFLLCRRNPWLLGLAFALCFLGGYPPILAGGAAAAWLVSWIASGRRLPEWRPWVLGAAGAAAAGAVMLLPAAELAAGSRRGGGMGIEDTLLFGLTPPDLLRFLSPLLAPDGEFSPAVVWWKTCYLGLAAAAAAAMAAPRLRRRALAGLAAYLAAAALLTLGGSTAPSLWVWSHLAPLRFVRYPGNLSYLVLPASALLVAAGLDRSRSAPWVAACLALELSVYALLAGPAVPRDFFTDAGPLVRRLQATLGPHRYLSSPLALQWHRGRGPDEESAARDLKRRLYGVTNLPYRLSAAGNFGEPLVPRASYDFMDFLYRLDIERAARWLAWADVRLLMTRDRFAAPTLLYEGRVLWHLYGVQPIPGRAVWFAPEAGERIPPGLPDEGAAAPGWLPRPGSGMPLDVERVREDRLRVRAETGDGWVYLAEPRAAGWRAWLDGRPVSALPALGAFQKLRVPGGRWELVLRYEPAAWRWGLCLTVAALLAAAAHWYNRVRVAV